MMVAVPNMPLASAWPLVAAGGSASRRWAMARMRSASSPPAEAVHPSTASATANKVSGSRRYSAASCSHAPVHVAPITG